MHRHHLTCTLLLGPQFGQRAGCGQIPHVYFCVKRIIRFGRVYAKWVLAVANLKGIVDDLRSQGIKSIRTITAELNARY
jgi:hypothetical protein